MPLKLSQTTINNQAREWVFDRIDEVMTINDASRINNSYFMIVPTEGGERLVEIATVVRSFKAKPNKDAESVSFDNAREMLDWLRGQEIERICKAEERLAEKERKKEANIAAKEKIAKKEAAKPKDVPKGSISGATIAAMIRQYQTDNN